MAPKTIAERMKRRFITAGGGLRRAADANSKAIRKLERD